MPEAESVLLMNKLKAEIAATLLAALFRATKEGAAMTMVLNPFVARAKRGRKQGVRDGGFVYAPGSLLVRVADEIVMNLKAPEDQTDLYLLSRIKRECADRMFDDMEKKPSGLVDVDERKL
jgi:hypothetical protein